MLDNFLFSVQVVLPVFITILLGTLGARAGILERDVMDKMAKITFNWFLSVKIALSTYDAELRNMTSMPMTWFCCFGLAAAFAVIWFLAHHLIRKKESVGAFVHCSFRGSITVLGLALVSSLAGDEGVALCAPIVALGSIENNLLAVMCLTRPGEGGSITQKLGRAVWKLVKNPMVLGAAAGCAANLLRIPCPVVIRTPLDYLASLAVPLSLLCIGTALDPRRVKGSLGLAAGAAFIKTVVMAAVLLPIAVWMGFRGTELAIIGFFFMLANPSGCYVMTLSMGGDAELTASATVLSTAFSVFTVTLMLYILRTLALI